MPPGITAALMPTSAYFVATVDAGRLRTGGADSVIEVPFGKLTSVHCMSNAHSIVRPAMTDLSFATMSTAVQARGALIVAAMQATATAVRVKCDARNMGRLSKIG